jgi:hypothetical protein
MLRIRCMFLKRKIVVSALATFISSPTIPAVVLFSASTPALAQLTQSQGRTIVIPAGTTFEGRIDATLSSRKSHQGDRFNVILSSPVLANGTDVLIPTGAMVIGEVVEAMASSHQPHGKKQHASGKLRVQITALKMPDGTTYPLVGSFIGETTGKGASRKVNPNLGGGVAYIGSQTNFNTVYPNSHPQGGGRNNKGPQLVTKKQMMDDPLLGDPDKSSNQQGQAPTIRSIVKDHYDLFIHEGSPMSVRLDAPLKMAIAPIGGMTPSAFSENDPGAAGRPTFSRPRSSIAAPPSPQAEAQRQIQQQPQVVAPPVPSGPAFLEPAPGTRPITPPPQAQMQMQQQMPMQSFGAPQGMPQSMPSAAPSGGGWFRPSTPADQAAAAQATPYFNAAPPAAQATPVQSFAQPQAPPAATGGFGAYQAPAQAAPAMSAGGFGAMPQQAMPQQAMHQQPIQQAMPQQAMPQQAMPQQAMQAMPQQAMQAMPQQATAAPGMMAQPASSFSAPAAPPMSAAAAAPLSAAPATAAPAHSSLPTLTPPVVPPAPPAGQSLDTFINSLGGAPASGAAATPASAPTAAPSAAPATPAVPAAGTATPAAVPGQKAP